jgi:hypothetical protein
LSQLPVTGDLTRIDRAAALRSERRSKLCVGLARRRYRTAVADRAKQMWVMTSSMDAVARFEKNREECCVCMDGSAATRFGPCDHLATCADCAAQKW